ncbi:hypothetical protein ACP70R_012325 [Stipagrostis hirtigluma subsp. patula]
MAATGRELPDDVLAVVLRRVPPRGLAASRCVCKAWRDVVDARRLLRADLLPRAVGGIFIEYCQLDSPEFLARPSRGPTISGDLEGFMPTFRRVVNHCNGLLLCDNYGELYVANPATRRYARLPPRPLPCLGEAFEQVECLVYDPTMSSQYEVFLIPLVPEEPETKLDSKTLQSEWPPSSYTMQVFSSTTGLWQEKSLARVGEAAGFATDVNSDYSWKVPHATAYWRGALYMHCQENKFLIRISLSNGTYKVVKTPTWLESTYYPHVSLGRSEKGVYCAMTHGFHGFSIFLLDESCEEMKWMLKHQVDLSSFTRKLRALEESGQRIDEGPWILQDINYNKNHSEEDNHKTVVEESFDWDSDDNDVINTDKMVEGQYAGYAGLLGFHPYKEIVFLNVSLRRAVAYHWNTSKFQDLGNLRPKEYYEIAGDLAEIDMAFPYTPCWLEELPGTNLEAQVDD